MAEEFDPNGYPPEEREQDVSQSRIGYKNPPKRTRFVKGNKAAAGKRRKKREKSLADFLRRELSKKVQAQIDGRRASLTNNEVIAMQLVAKAKLGDLGAIRLVNEFMGPGWLQPTEDIPTGIKVIFVPPDQSLREEQEGRQPAGKRSTKADR